MTLVSCFFVAVCIALVIHVGSNAAIEFSENFSGGLAGWTIGGSGGAVTIEMNFPNPGISQGNYLQLDVPFGANRYVEKNIVLPNATTITLSFKTWGARDAVTATVSVIDGAVTNNLASFDPLPKISLVVNPAPTTKTYDLTAWKGKTVKLRFRATSPNSTGTGAAFDDILITSVISASVLSQSVTDARGGANKAYAADGQPITAIVADGVAEAKITLTVSGAGAFTLQTPAGAMVGTVRNPLSSTYGTSATVNAALASDGNFYATINYRSPTDFNNSDATLNATGFRNVILTGSFTPSGGSATPISQTMRIVRPPLVLVHGIWSNESTWDQFIGSLNSLALLSQSPPIVRFRDQQVAVSIGGQAGSWISGLVVATVDYRGTTGRTFADNEPLVLSKIQSTLLQLRLNGIAVEQVDYVGHSMGGILGRIIAGGAGTSKWDGNSKNPLTNSATGKGYIHKLVTLHTPHLGASAARALIAKLSGNFSDNLAEDMAWALGASYPGIPQGSSANDIARIKQMLAGGAVSDLRNVSGSAIDQTIRDLPAVTTHSVHLMSGELGVVRSLLLPPLTRLAYSSANSFGFFISPFGRIFPIISLNFDGIVSGGSQRMNISPGSEGVSSPTDREHTEATSYGSNVTFIIALLNAPISGTLFRTLPANSSINIESVTGLAVFGLGLSDTSTAISDQSKFRIASPTINAILKSGSNVTVNVFVDTTFFIPESVTISGSWNPLSATTVNDTPFSRILTIDTSFIGTARIYAIGFDTSDTLVFDSIFITVVPADSLTALIPADSPLVATVGAATQITMYGLFGTDTTNPKYLTGQSVVPLNYTSQNTAIATVDVNGLVVGVSDGFTQIMVSSGDTTVVVGVQVTALAAAAAVVAASTTVAPAKQYCVISRLNCFPSFWLDFRTWRDWMLSSVAGRALVGLYYTI